MPATPSLPDSVSTAAFTVPDNAVGFIVWNTTSNSLRLRIGKPAAASGDNEGIPIPPGNTTPTYFVHYFSRPPQKGVPVNIFQSSGGEITSGVGYDILKY